MAYLNKKHHNIIFYNHSGSKLQILLLGSFTKVSVCFEIATSFALQDETEFSITLHGCGTHPY